MLTRDLEKQLADIGENSPKATVIFGARRVGKTTLLRKLFQKGRTVWISGDYADEASLLDFGTAADVRSFLEQADTVVIDEAQRIPGIGLKLKRLVDANELREQKTRIFVTGSSSLALAGDIQDSAVGRLRRYALWPLSFRELAQNIGSMNAYQDLPMRLIYGMYPAVVTDPESARQTLEDYCEGILFKDIFALTGTRKPSQFMDLVINLAQMIGSEVSYDSLAKNTGLDKKTVARYIDLLEQCFIVRRCQSYSRNLAKELKKGKKIYFCDLGIRNCLIRNFSPLNARQDSGALWENFFFMERLKHHDLNKTFVQQYFWRTRENSPKEIDFVEAQDNQLQTFECNLSPHAKAIMPEDFTKTYGAVPFHLVTPESAWPFIADGCVNPVMPSRRR